MPESQTEEVKVPKSEVKSESKKSSKKDKSSEKDNFYGLSELQIKEAYKTMLTSRLTDDRIDTLIKQGKATFLISGAGHEAIQTACALAMKPGKDWFFAYYRDNALALQLGVTPEAIMQHTMGKATDPFSGGRQMPMVIGSKEFRIPTASLTTGSQYLEAVGAALSAVYRETDEVAYAGGGEGSTSEGEFWEAVNWAAREKLPVIFLIQNNKFAISVPVEQQTAGGSVYQATEGFTGLTRIRVDGTHFFEGYKVCKDAVKRARNGEGPTLIYADVVRLRSHSASDAQEKYRTKEDLENDKQKDCITLLEKSMLDNGIMTGEEMEKMKKDITNEIMLMADEVWKQAAPDASTVEDFLFCPENEQAEIKYEADDTAGEPVVMVDAINHALHEEMEKNPNMIVYGEDVQDNKGGVFTATKGLSNKYGAKRCFNSPLAEASIVGTAIGAALSGLKPVVEIQFADYIWPAMMQIRDELAMFRYRSNNTFPAPVTIRVACGGYIQGGPYHSQNIEAIFAKCAGIKIAYPSNAADAKGLLKTACQLNDPVLFLEHKFLYRQGYAKSPEPGKDYYLPFGKAVVKNMGEDISIICYGAMVDKAMRAAKEMAKKDISVEVVDIRTIVPLDTETIINSVKKTGKVIVLHEDSKFMGFGAEIVSVISEQAFQYLDAPIKRVAGLHVHVPYHINLEKVALPQNDWVVKACEELAAY